MSESRSSVGADRETEFLTCDVDDQLLKTNKRETYIYNHFTVVEYHIGDVAQMVERSLSMREVRGSIPRISIMKFFLEMHNK